MAQSDNLSNLRQSRVAVNAAGQLVDTLTVVPQSLTVYALPGLGEVATNQYDLQGRFLRWLRLPPTDSVLLTYRVLPFDLLAGSQLIDTTALKRDEFGQLIGTYDPYVRGDVFDSDGGVNYRGSFSRGFSVGNRQDLVLNSAFNLQLEGELGNGVQVKAAITDESLPIQPEGNTQQLREFDKIFIQLTKDRSSLTAGDYELRNPEEGYFMRYNKKLEGATVRSESGATDPTQGGRWVNSASIAVARGQFIRQTIEPGEGNQGPYQLRGDGNQRFLIVLSGTEKIYLDGQLLQRGQDADYVIDYNLAELKFTQRRLITRDSRIAAEYEYADQRYLRTLYAGNTRYERGPWTAYFNLLSQQDSKTATGDLQLDDNQRRRLSEAGDNPDGAFVNSIDTLEGRADQRATYVQIDTVVNCNGEMRPINVLRISNNTEATLFTASFTDFGPNGGLYELIPRAESNERAYRFVGYDPLNCEMLGNFLPQVAIAAPRKDQLMAFGGTYQTKRTTLALEGATSIVDLNRFSDLDSSDDQGFAGTFSGEQLIPLGKTDSSWQLVAAAEIEILQANFRPLNPYRSPDFFRDWNLSNRLGTVIPAPSDEQILGGEIKLQRIGWGQLTYAVGRYEREGSYLGNRQAASLNFNRNNWNILADVNQLTNTQTDSRGAFYRPSVRLSKRFTSLDNWELSTEYTAERSEQRGLEQDTLLPFSFGFQRYGVGLRSGENEKYSLSINARRRLDFLPGGGTELVSSTNADELLLEGNYEPGKNLRLGGNFTYRELMVSSTDLITQQPGRTFLGRLDVNFKAIQNSIRSQTAYTLGSGQEPRVDFQYLYVGPGLGQYIWQDSLYNNDGRIQPNEMEIGPFADQADYVRVSVFTDDFIRTDNAGLNQSIQWDPSRLWKGAKGAKKFVKKFNVQSSLTIDRKTRNGNDIQVWNPLQLAISDSSLVALNAGSRQAVFFNRANPKYDLQFSRRDQRRRQVLTTGYEANRQREYELQLRIRPNRSLSFIVGGVAGQRDNDSENFNNKDYAIVFQRIEPKLEWQPGEDYRFDLGIILGREANELITGLGESANRRELKFEGSYRRWLRLQLSNIQIDFTGEAQSPIGFALLNGLQPGRNWLWNLGATRQLGKYLQLSLNYEGRQTGIAKTVHVGRAQVTALF